SIREVEAGLREVAESLSCELEQFVGPPRRGRGKLLAVAGGVALGVALIGVFGAARLSRHQPAAAGISMAAAPHRIAVAFESSPPGAKVFRAGESTPLGMTPFALSFERSSQPQSFEFRLPGRQVAHQEVSMAESSRVVVALARATAIEAAGPTEQALPTGHASASVAKKWPAAPARPGGSHRSKTPRKVTPPRPLDRGGVMDPFAEP